MANQDGNTGSRRSHGQAWRESAGPDAYMFLAVKQEASWYIDTPPPNRPEQNHRPLDRMRTPSLPFPEASMVYRTPSQMLSWMDASLRISGTET